jgi:DNA-binding NtrC family response regulator
MTNKILVIDDEQGILDLFYTAFHGEKYHVITAKTATEGLKLAETEKPALILLDVILKGKDGLELLKEIKNNDKDAVVIIVTGYGTVETAEKAMKYGAYNYLIKPFDIIKVEKMIQEALHLTCLKKDVKTLKEKLKEAKEKKEEG